MSRDEEITEQISASTVTKSMLIPGLDCPMKEEDTESDPLNEEQSADTEMTDAEKDGMELKPEEGPLSEDGVAGEGNSTIKEEESVEVKVIEYEIAIVPLVKCDPTTGDQEEPPTSSETATLSSTAVIATDECTNDSTSGGLSPKPSAGSESTESHSPTGKAQAGGMQLKRGGIVIKMKKANSTSTSTAMASEVSGTSTEPGNVLPSSSDSALDVSEPAPEHISSSSSYSNVDNKVDAADTSDVASTNVEQTNGTTLVTQLDEQVEAESGEPARSESSEKPSADETSGQVPLPSPKGIPSAGEGMSPLLDIAPETEADPDALSELTGDKCELENYYSRGQETSALCTIM